MAQIDRKLLDRINIAPMTKGFLVLRWAQERDPDPKTVGSLMKEFWVRNMLLVLAGVLAFELVYPSPGLLRATLVAVWFIALSGMFVWGSILVTLETLGKEKKQNLLSQETFRLVAPPKWLLLFNNLQSVVLIVLLLLGRHYITVVLVFFCWVMERTAMNQLRRLVFANAVAMAEVELRSDLGEMKVVSPPRG
jgi:hypothetical protein